MEPDMDVQPLSVHADGATVQAAADKVVHRSNELFGDEKPEQARAVIGEFLETHDRAEIWFRLAKAYRLLGDNLAARAILRNVILKLKSPHIMEIIAARVPHTKAIVLDNARIVYINIPKCGSSTMKDAVLVANQRELRGETSHYHVREYERIISFSELDGQYKDYTKFAIIRQPRARLRSYYTKNIAEAESLKKEAGGRDSFYGLSTKPSYEEVVAKFQLYRNVFDDFRHHTDSTVGYLGQTKSRFTRLFDVSETRQAIDLLETATGGAIPTIHNMQSKTPAEAFRAENPGAETRLIESFYARETELYFS